MTGVSVPLPGQQRTALRALTPIPTPTALFTLRVCLLATILPGAPGCSPAGKNDASPQAGSAAGLRVYDLVRRAVVEKKTIVATYDGYRRKMCPHIIGMKDGKSHALFYQFSGAAARPLQPDGSRYNWRCVFLDRLSNVVVEDGEWHTAGNYSAIRQTCVDAVDAEVEP